MTLPSVNRLPLQSTMHVARAGRTRTRLVGSRLAGTPRRDMRRQRFQLATLGVERLEPRLAFALIVPALSSLPGADHTIYLDFDGHVTSGTAWNSGATINSPAYSSDGDFANFSESELSVIRQTFHRVSEDFAPFRVNVTTVAPPVEDLRKTGGTDRKWGVRVVITDDVAFSCGCGGLAYIDSFNWSSDTPAFVFNSSEIGVAEAVSHEVGHSLGLSHDGTSSLSYYQGHGLGTDGAYWSSIMGVGYYVDVSHWDRGEYAGSNNGTASANYGKGPDDLAIIANYNGFGYRADDHADTLNNATLLTQSGNNLSSQGLISTRADVDYFRFSTSGGRAALRFLPAEVGANLDIRASLYNAAGTLLRSSNPLQSLTASMNTDLTAGTYYLKVEGVGAGTPTATVPTGYTDYASLGMYSIQGTVTPAVGASLSISADTTNLAEGTNANTLHRFTVQRSGSTSSSSSVSYAVEGSGPNPAAASDFVGQTFPSGLLNFGPGVTIQTVTVRVRGDATVESNESFLVRLSNPSPTTSLGSATATGQILNDDAPPSGPFLSIAATDAAKPEGTGTGSTPFVFTISRSGNLQNPSTVAYSLSAIGANPAAANDIVGGFVQNQAVSFAPGVAAVDVTIPVRRDAVSELTETFRVTLTNPVGATITTHFAHGAIRNDDGTGAGPSAGPMNLIAVADPLWMFIPAESLTAEQRSVPVMTWIDGVPFLGDVAHDHPALTNSDHSPSHGSSGGCGCSNGSCSMCQAFATFESQSQPQSQTSDQAPELNIPLVAQASSESRAIGFVPSSRPIRLTLPAGLPVQPVSASAPEATANRDMFERLGRSSTPAEAWFEFDETLREAFDSLDSLGG